MCCISFNTIWTRFVNCFITAQSPSAWESGVNWGGANEFIITSGSNGFTLKPTGDAAISGNLDVNVSNSPSPIKAYNTMDGYTSCIQLEAKWNSQAYMKFESNKPGALYVFITVKDDLHMYCGNNKVHMCTDTSIDGNLDVGQSQAQTSIKAYFNHAGSTGHIRIEGRYRDQGFLHFETNYQYGDFLIVRNTFFIRCSNYAGNPYVQTF